MSRPGRKGGGIGAWVSPDCGRRFKHRNQEHSCVRLNPDDHFVGKEPRVRKIYDRLLSEVMKFGNVDVSPVKNGVMLKGQSTFLAVKPKKSWVDIEFILGEEVNVYPVHKAFRYTKSKVVALRPSLKSATSQQEVDWVVEGIIQVYQQQVG
jgi:Domain of unknown function (DUF5655)